VNIYEAENCIIKTADRRQREAAKIMSLTMFLEQRTADNENKKN
jgi:hypothetical protein